MNLCNFCTQFSKKPRCCKEPYLKSFLGIVIPTGIQIYRCDFFEPSQLGGDVCISVNGKKVIYNQKQFKNKPKTIYHEIK